MESNIQTRDKWSSADDQGLGTMGPVTTHELENATGDTHLDNTGTSGQAPEVMKANEDTSGNKADSGREKQLKPSKVYVGGLPDHTRQEDLRNCFGKIGNIASIELKVGYGFVEFESKEAAEESVAKYHEGFFMGNKIRVELSHNRGRTAKRSEDPGACFKCGESGHWARECPRQTTQSRAGPMHDPILFDRTHPLRDHPPLPPRDFPPYRDELTRYQPPRDARFYDYPPMPPPGRDYRLPMTPPRDSRDFPPMGFPLPRRDYDDYRIRGPPPLPPLPPPSRYGRPGLYGPERDHPPKGYMPPSPPPSRDFYERYDRRPPMDDRLLPPPNGGRPRTPPGPPPEGRGRPITPPREYPRYSSDMDRPRYRRRSLSPPPRHDLRYGGPGHHPNDFDGDRYAAPPRDGGRPPRDYHPRNGRDDGTSYRRP
ncbi:hypothetical protein PAXINDRAFT_164924 [Paxillus involutus ATCC 200175]|nr:hypothetical protein PAXINDRAFT_164924 [Paxillus involutus ATCC 200175]